ncbi:MAG: hypothetical protein JMDDDDMK_03686 [Acidobacteria bacterium]|nr:hypothetical protein [Acidobacteriota bacterium]
MGDAENRPVVKGTELIDQTRDAVRHAEGVLEATGVKLPADRVELYVKETTVYQLLEYARDESIFLSLASLSAGAALGVIVNWATADSAQLSKAGWVALVIFVAVTLIFIWSWLRVQKRSGKIKERIEKERIKSVDNL